jgi:malonyl CoA-acyl carrier protein transacylase
MKKRALVICPGRGTYNKTELGYLAKWHSDKPALIGAIDQYRNECKQMPISELDTMASYSMSKHTRGDNASALVYACAYSDFLSINRDAYELVAVTGNSLGWYVTLGCASALSPADALKVINTMGTLMHQHLQGGQIVYPLLDDQWCEIEGRQAMLDDALESVNQQSGCELYVSIRLGGFVVFAGNDAGLKALTQILPVLDERYPMRLFYHCAIHSPLLQAVSQIGSDQLSNELFKQAQLPMIDGRGHIWYPHSTDTDSLWDYTLGEQVVDTYNFTKAIQVAVKEFAPDKLIVLGPGTTLGGAVAQSLIDINWQGLSCKQDFIDRQQSDDPLVVSMGMDEQRGLAIN